MRTSGFAAALLLAGAAHAQTISVTGRVGHAGPIDLAALKQVEVSGTFNSMSGKQTHRWRGPLLLDVLDHSGITDEPGKRTHMRHVILASGTDSYGAAIALGEIDRGAEGKQVIIALMQDGTKLRTPRLVVTGDASLTRSVHDLAVLEVR